MSTTRQLIIITAAPGFYTVIIFFSPKLWNHNNSNDNYTNITTTIVSDHNKNVTNESTRLFEEFVLLILLPKLLSRNHKEERGNKNSHSFDSNIKDTSIIFTLQMLLNYIDSSNKKKNIKKGNNDASILTLQYVLSKRTTPGELLPLIHNDANVDNNDGVLLLLLLSSLISKRVDRIKKKESPTLLHCTEGLL